MKLIEIRAKCEFSFFFWWFFVFSDGGDGDDDDDDDGFADWLLVADAYLHTDISYWKHEVGGMGFMKEITGANLTGGVAVTGSLREIKGDELEQARKSDSSMSS